LGEFIRQSADVLVIGGGQAALRAAIEARKQGADVAIAAKGKIGLGGSSSISDGVHSAIFSEGDAPEHFFADMIKGGREVGDRKLLQIMAEECTSRVAELHDQFHIELHYEKEVATPGHSFPRRVYAEGGKGGIVTRKLRDFAEQIGVRFYENMLAVELIRDDRVGGAIFLSKEDILLFQAGSTVLATGGLGGLYDHSDNPRDVTGEGIGMALRHGAIVQDLEFIQFYPYRLVQPRNVDLYTKLFAKGAVMRNKEGQRFMDAFPRKELETRDIICYEMYKQGEVYLDISNVPSDIIKEVSHNLFRILEKGYSGELIVSPVEHYSIGGIKIDEYGRTGVPGLYACGECTGGIHGANRLGGGSLTESLVFGSRIGRMAAEESQLAPAQKSLTIDENYYDPLRFNEDWNSEEYRSIRRNLQKIMWDHVGIERTSEGLEQGVKLLMSLKESFQDSQKASARFLLDILDVAYFTALTASMRKESRGAHRVLHDPDHKEEWKGNFLIKDHKVEFRGSVF
jgi:aspartate oxidase